MALLYDANPLVTDLPSLSILDAVNRIREDGEDRIAGCLENLQTFVDALTQRLGEIPEGRFEDLIVTDADTGAAIAHIGSFPAGDSILSGVATQNLWVGGDVNDPVNTAPLFTDGTTVVVGQNGRIFLRNTRGDDKGFIGVETEDPDNPLTITAAANNGAGLIRLTVTGHGYESGDTVDADIPGVASGTWGITVIDADTFDLLGSTFAGAYTGGGTVYRYFGGVWSETAAFGNTGFGDALFRVFADSSLRIGSAAGARLEVDNAGNLSLRDAALSIETAAILIEIDETNGVKVTNKSSGLYSRVDTDGVQVKNSGDANVGCYVSDDQIVVKNGTGTQNQVSLAAVASNGGLVQVTSASGAVVCELNGFNGRASCLELYVNGVAYSPSNYYTKSEIDTTVSALISAINGKSSSTHYHTVLTAPGNTSGPIG